MVDSRHLRLAPPPLRSHNPAERRRGWSREDRLGTSIVWWHTFAILCILMPYCAYFWDWIWTLNGLQPTWIHHLGPFVFWLSCSFVSLMLFTNVLIFRIPACRDFLFASFCIFFCNLAYNKLLKVFSVTAVLSTCDCELCPLIVWHCKRSTICCPTCALS